MNWKHALLGIAALALCAYLPVTSAGAFTSPIPAPCDVGCSVTDGIETCAWLLPEGPPQQWAFDMIDQHTCTMTTCDGTILTCSWSVPVTPTPAVPTPTRRPTPTPEPSTWSDAGLWMGMYRLLVNERGDYCIPELAGCG